MIMSMSCFQIRSTIEEYNAKGVPVAAMIIEPIQAEGGDNYASPQFFVDLQAVLKEVRYTDIQYTDIQYDFPKWTTHVTG